MSAVIGASGLLLLATSSIWLGAVLGSKKPEPKDDEITEEETIELTWSQVLMMPLSSSIFLLLLFYFFAYLQLILVFFVILGSALSCAEVIKSSIASFVPSLSGKFSTVFSVLFTIIVVAQWAMNGSFIAHDILGCSICISSIALIRFPSLKLAAVCLGLLLLYDIFWVFFSEYFFQKNVMVDVATKSAYNPLHAVGEMYHISMLMALQPKLDLPIKLLIQASSSAGGRVMMLGLGDIALPGFLVSFALRCDMYQTHRLSLPQYSPESLLLQDSKSMKSNSSTGRGSANLFEFSMVGYILGLLLAFYIGSISGHAQPALIYLVPGVVIPIAVRAWQKNIFMEVWNGPSKSSD
jgi:Signal peptide peptidase